MRFFILIFTVILSPPLHAQKNPGRLKQPVDVSSKVPKYRVEKKWNNNQERNAEVEIQARNWLRDTPGSSEFDEAQLNQAREFYEKQLRETKEQIRNSPNEFFFILRIQERMGDQELQSIAEDVAPNDMSSRDAVTVTFYLNRVPIGGGVFATATIRSNEVKVSRSGLTQDEYDCFIGSELPTKPHTLGPWLDDDTMLRIEGKKPNVTLVRYHPSGDVSEGELVPLQGRTIGFKPEAEDCDLSIQNGSLVKSVRGNVVATYAKAPIKKLGDAELKQIKIAMIQEKQKLNELLDRLLIAKDDIEYESISVQTNGKFHDLYEEIKRHCHSRPTGKNYLPFQVRMARYKLFKLSQLYWRDKPGFGQGTAQLNPTPMQGLIPGQRLGQGMSQVAPTTDQGMAKGLGMGQGTSAGNDFQVPIPTAESTLVSLRETLNLFETKMDLEPKAIADESPHPAKAGATERIWTDASGKFSIKAAFVSCDAGRIVLRKSDGQQITVPQQRLSQSDQEFIRALVASSNSRK